MRRQLLLCQGDAIGRYFMVRLRACGPHGAVMVHDMVQISCLIVGLRNQPHSKHGCACMFSLWVVRGARGLQPCRGQTAWQRTCVSTCSYPDFQDSPLPENRGLASSSMVWMSLRRGSYARPLKNASTAHGLDVSVSMSRPTIKHACYLKNASTQAEVLCITR